MTAQLGRRAFAGLASLAAWAAGSDSAGAATLLRIGYTPLAEYLGAYVARDRGFFAEHGVDVRFTAIPLNPTIPPALLSGSIEIGALNAAVFLLALDGGMDLVAIAGATITPRGHASFALGLRPGVAYDGPRSLVGRKILLPGLKSSVDVLFRRWLRGNGVDPDSLGYIELPSPRTPDALRSASADGAVIVEPYLTRVQQDGIVGTVVRFADELPKDILGTLFIAERGWVDRNQAALAGFRAGLAQGMQFALARPDEARADLAPYISLPPPVLATLPYPALEMAIAPDGLAFWIEAMAREGMLTRAIDPAAVIAG